MVLVLSQENQFLKVIQSHLSMRFRFSSSSSSFFFFCFLGPPPQHMEVSRLGVETEL